MNCNLHFCHYMAQNRGKKSILSFFYTIFDKMFSVCIHHPNLPCVKSYITNVTECDSKMCYVFQWRYFGLCYNVKAKYIYIKSLSNLCHCVAVCNTVTSKSSCEQRMSNIFPSLFLSALSTQQDIELELALKAGKLIFIWDKYRKQIFSTAPNYESL